MHHILQGFYHFPDFCGARSSRQGSRDFQPMMADFKGFHFSWRVPLVRNSTKMPRFNLGSEVLNWGRRGRCEGIRGHRLTVSRIIRGFPLSMAKQKRWRIGFGNGRRPTPRRAIATDLHPFSEAALMPKILGAIDG